MVNLKPSFGDTHPVNIILTFLESFNMKNSVRLMGWLIYSGVLSVWEAAEFYMKHTRRKSQYMAHLKGLDKQITKNQQISSKKTTKDINYKFIIILSFEIIKVNTH